MFEIEAQGDKIVLGGNNGVSLAMAFNWYLCYQVLINLDWQAAGPLKFEGALPIPKEKTHQVCEARERFFMNYCTYGYSLPWWGWDQWQRFVDWMAMNGINRPLMQAGQAIQCVGVERGSLARLETAEQHARTVDAAGSGFHVHRTRRAA